MPLSALALAAGILLGRSAPVWHAGALLLAASALVMGCFRGRTRRAAFLAAAVAIGFLRGYAAYHPKLPEPESYLATGVIADEIHLRNDGQVRTILRRVTLNGKPVSGGVYWTGYPKELPEGLEPGATVTVTASAYHPNGADNPGGFDFREYLLERGIRLGLYGMDDAKVTGAAFTLTGWAARVRHDLTEGLTRVMGMEAGGYAAAMLLGNRELIASEDRAAFNRLGIAHVLSVSGYHVGVLAGMLALLFRRLHVRQGLRIAVTAAVLAAYCLLTGLNPPVIRAAALVILFQLGRWQQRQNLGLHLLSASAAAILLVSPAQLMSASFQLTYGAMLGLQLVFPMLERWVARKGSRFRNLRRALCAGFAAQLGILIPQVYWFQEIPLLAFPLNVLVLTGAGALISLYWLVLALLILQPIAAVVGAVAGWITGCLLGAIRALGSLEGIVLWVKQANLATFVGWSCLMAGLSNLWRRRRGWPIAMGAAIMALSLAPWPHTGASYLQLSVGNADAAVLHDRDMVVVIDAGEEGDELATYLKQQRLSIDLLMLTHLHADHAGGIRALMDNGIPVRSVCVPVGAHSAAVDESVLALLAELTDTGAELRELARGDVIPLPDGAMTVVWPERDKVRPGMDANLHSLVTLAEVKGTTMLLAGDLDGAYELYAAAGADILKVAHHGSSASTSEAFLEAVGPEVLILSCGDATRQLSMEERRGEIPLYGTREHGAIRIDFDDGCYNVSTVR